MLVSNTGNPKVVLVESKKVVPMLDNFAQDLRQALRGFHRNPGFALTVILTVALGIGVTTAVFSVVDRILFRSLPYPNSDQLVSFGLLAPIEPNEFMLGTDYVEWRARQTPFAAMTTWSGTSDCDLTDQNPQRLNCAHVESTFLSTFAVSPVMGRNFTREEDQPNAPLVVLLSFGFWQSRFAGGNPLGQVIPVDGQPATIIGVLPRDFELPNLAKIDLLLPQSLNEAAQKRPNTGRVLRAYARLHPDVSPAQAKAALQPLFEEALKWVPAPFRKEVKLEVRSLHERQIHDARLASWMLLGSVLAVLLIACANVASLLLARGVRLQQEMAVRVALGAGRARLIRQQLTESVLLGLLGGAAGCLLAAVLLHVSVTLAPEGVLRLNQATLDLRVLLFAFAASAGSGIFIGLASAFARPRVELLAGNRATAIRRGYFHQSIVVAQIAATFVLLAGAGLLLRSLMKLQSVPTGMHTENVITAGINLNRQKYAEPAQQTQFFEQLLARMRRAPGLVALGLSDSLPPSGSARSTLYATIEVEGRPRPDSGTGGMVVWRSVTPGYFSALGIPILRGRGFSEEDRQPSQQVIILSECLAARMFPGEEPLGKRLRPGLTGPWLTVIGIAGEVKNGGLSTAADPEFYRVRKLSPEDAWNYSSVILRSALHPQMLAEWVRAEISAQDPTLPVAIQTMDQRVRGLQQRPRFNAMLLTLFAALAVALAALGIYGLLAFLVAERTQEIGIRLALGGTPSHIRRLVLGHGVLLLALGGVLGLGASLALTRLLKSLLFAVQPNDPVTLATVAVLLVGVALLACSLPARRAVRVDPAVAIRNP